MCESTECPLSCRTEPDLRRIRLREMMRPAGVHGAGTLGWWQAQWAQDNERTVPNREAHFHKLYVIPEHSRLDEKDATVGAGRS